MNGSRRPARREGPLAMRMNAKPRSGNSRRILAGVVVSAAAHLLLFVLLMFATPENVQPPRREKVNLNVVDRLKKSDFDKAPLVSGMPKPESDDRLDGQVVTLPEPAVQQKPDSARFLSQYDIKVDREQVARVRGGAPPGRKSGGQRRPAVSAEARTEGQPEDGTLEEAANGGEGATAGQAARPAYKGLKGFDNLLLPSSAAGGRGGSLNMQMLADQMLGDDSLAIGDGEGGTPGGGGFGGGGSDDVFMGVEDEGDVTLVNSRSFKFWAFFDRVKTQVRGEWDPGTIFRSRDPYGKVFGKKDRYTILGVVLGPDGAIRQLEVVHKSGLDFLDEEAARAFQAAGPFPNPPTGLIDESGRIVFRFGFLLEFGSSTGSFFWQRPN